MGILIILLHGLLPMGDFKYLNPAASRNIIFNELYLDFDKEITTCWRYFRCDESRITPFPFWDQRLSEYSILFKKIVKYDTPVLLALDKDAKPKALKIKRLLLKYGIEVREIDLEEYEDVGEMSKDEFKRLSSDGFFYSRRRYSYISLFWYQLGEKVKFAHIADTHIRNLKYHYEYKIVFDKLYQTLKDENVDYIIHCGDIAHTKTQISPEFVEMCTNFFRSLADIAPTYIILGNHDGNLKNSNRQDALTPIVRSSGPLSNLHLLKNSGEVPLEGWFCPKCIVSFWWR